MRKTFKSLLSLSAVIFIAGLYNSSVYGVPAFARQTGLDCTSCHGTFGYPTLNSFGAAFKAGGYTNASEDSLMGDGEDLSLPKVLNLSSVIKMRAIFALKDSAGNKAEGFVDELNMPDEISFFYGGRVAKNIGVKIEMGIKAPESGVLSFAMPYVVPVGPVTIGAVPYWTDAAGPAWFFETLSTGNASNIRAAEKHKGPIHPQGDVGSDFDTAAGLGVYVWHPYGFVAYSPFLNWGPFNASGNPKASHYVRAAVTPTVGPVDLAAGFMMTTGARNNGQDLGCMEDPNLGTIAQCDLGHHDSSKIGADIQVMGNVGIPIGVTFSWAKFTQDVTATDTYNGGVGIYAEAGVIENLLNLGVGYIGGSNSVAGVANTDGSSLDLVLKANLARNVRYHFEFVMGMGDNKSQKFTNMIFAAF